MEPFSALFQEQLHDIAELAEKLLLWHSSIELPSINHSSNIHSALALGQTLSWIKHSPFYVGALGLRRDKFISLCFLLLFLDSRQHGPADSLETHKSLLPPRLCSCIFLSPENCFLLFLSMEVFLYLSAKPSPLTPSSGRPFTGWNLLWIVSTLCRSSQTSMHWDCLEGWMPRLVFRTL